MRFDRPGILLATVLFLVGAAAPVTAQTQWTAGVGLWTDVGNWSAGVPSSTFDADIANGGTAQVTTPGQECSAATLGGSSTLLVDGAGLLECLQVYVSNNSGASTLTISNGGEFRVNQFFGGLTGPPDVGQVTLTGTGSLLAATSSAQLGGGLPGGQITVDLSNGGEFSSAGFTLAGAGSTATINVGTGGVAGVLAGNVSLGGSPGTGTVNFNHTNAISFAFDISGGIVVSKSGTGTLTLTGTNTYTGGTTVSGGTLSGTTTSLQDDIVNNATIEFDQAAGGTYAGVLSGTGALVKDGTGIVTLSNTGNSYSGATTVSGGILRAGAADVFGDESAVTIAAGATLDLNNFNQAIGSLAGAGSVTLGSATLTTTPAAATTFSGVISGSGGLVTAGINTVTLTGANTYTGGTTVSAGSPLRGSTAGIQGNITNSGQVEFNQGTNGTYAGIISGTGDVAKTGTGAVTLSANNTYTGSTNLSNGSLFVNGSISNSTITVQTGTVLGGDGTVGVILVTGGTVTPGLSPAILNSGTVTFDAASTFTVELDGATVGTGYDQLNVTGTVTLGDATLTVLPGFTAPAGTTFIIISNDLADAISGTFAGLAEGATVTAGGQTFQISYVGGDGNDVVLSVAAAVPSLPFAGFLALAALLAGLGYLRLRA